MYRRGAQEQEDQVSGGEHGDGEQSHALQRFCGVDWDDTETDGVGGRRCFCRRCLCWRLIFG